VTDSFDSLRDSSPDVVGAGTRSRLTSAPRRVAALLRPLWRSSLARPATAMPRLWPTAWVTVLPLIMVLATEYKFRQRPLSESLGGSVDSAIIVELGGYAFVAAYLVLFVISPPQLRRPTAINFFMRGYALALCFSVTQSAYPQLGAARATQLLVSVICASAIATRASRRQMLQLAHGFVALVTASVYIGLYYRVPFSRLQAGRFSWIYMHPVTAGAMLALGLVLAAGLMTNRNELRFGLDHWPRPFYLISIVTMLGGLLGTETRGAIGAAVAGLFVVGFLTLPRRERVPVGVLATMGIGLMAVWFIKPVATYLARGESAANLATVSNRTELWGIAYDLVKERPYTGWGLSTSRGIFFDRVGLGGAHNAFVNVSVDGGLIGAGLWVAFVVAIGIGIRRLYKAGHRDAPLLAGLLTALMVNGLTVEGVGSGIGMSALWLLLTGAWVGVLQREVGAQRQRTTAGPVDLVSTGQHSRPGRSAVLEISRVSGRNSTLT